MVTQSTRARTLDLRKTLPALYKPRGTACTLVNPPVLQVVAVEGAGDPNTSPAWRAAVEALYSTAYSLKFMLKKAGDTPDFSVMPLEALWWAADIQDFRLNNRSNWLWRALIVLPDFVTSVHVNEALSIARGKKNIEALESVEFSTFAEGASAQVLHIGPYAEESPTIARLHAFIEAQGLVPTGRHHEIYLSDPKRAAPEKMKTIIRQPVKQAAAHIESLRQDTP